MQNSGHCDKAGAGGYNETTFVQTADALRRSVPHISLSFLSHAFLTVSHFALISPLISLIFHSKGLAALGYVYLNLDDCWIAENRTKDGKVLIFKQAPDSLNRWTNSVRR